jgi:hypothetical protein
MSKRTWENNEERPSVSSSGNADGLFEKVGVGGVVEALGRNIKPGDKAGGGGIFGEIWIEGNVLWSQWGNGNINPNPHSARAMFFYLLLSHPSVPKPCAMFYTTNGVKFLHSSFSSQGPSQPDPHHYLQFATHLAKALLHSQQPINIHSYFAKFMTMPAVRV